MSVEDQFRLPKSGYLIDMWVYDMCVNAKRRTGTVTRWTVEFDGPSHILTCRCKLVGP